MSQTKVGVIGYNEGNGHPYSFSSIINGYDLEEMNNSPYPGIAKYLSARKAEEFGIGDWKVTHVWAPDPNISENIAVCTNINHVVENYQDMIDEVEVLLLLRDDAESHRKIATPFLENGKTVFIDKPLCINNEDLQFFKPWLENGKLMSCSGLRYYPTIKKLASGSLQKQDIVFSHNVSIIDWFRYGIHVLEGITPIMGTEVAWVQDVGEPGNHIVRVQYKNGTYALIQVNTELGFILRSTFYTRNQEHITIDYDDNFTCFRNTIKKIHQQFLTGQPAIDPAETIAIIKIMLAANDSINNRNKKVPVDTH